MRAMTPAAVEPLADPCLPLRVLGEVDPFEPQTWCVQLRWGRKVGLARPEPRQPRVSCPFDDSPDERSTPVDLFPPQVKAEERPRRADACGVGRPESVPSL